MLSSKTPADFDILRPKGKKAPSAGKLQAVSKASENSVDIELVSYKSKATAAGENNGLDLITFWAVDPAYDGKVFRPVWWTCKGARNSAVKFKANWIKVNPNEAGKARILACDIYGGETFYVIDD